MRRCGRLSEKSRAFQLQLHARFVGTIGLLISASLLVSPKTACVRQSRAFFLIALTDLLLSLAFALQRSAMWPIAVIQPGNLSDNSAAEGVVYPDRRNHVLATIRE